MPGVLTVGSDGADWRRVALTEFPDRAERLMVFAGIEEARFRKPIVPGRSDAYRGGSHQLETKDLEDARQVHCRWPGRSGSDITCALLQNLKSQPTQQI